MKTTQLKWTATVAALALGTTLSPAAQTTLKVGDPAPKLQVGKWVQGDPVKEFQEGKAYIVEFWATWCGPCRVSIPHLNEIHNKFKDKGLIVIGQDCWEGDESLVEPFIKKMDDQMTYRVALDDKKNTDKANDKPGSDKGKMAETWMEAAGQNGIPSAFLVDTKGVIAWIGHPMNLKEEVIEQVLTEKFDLKKAAVEYEKQMKKEMEMRAVWTDLNRAMQKKNWEEATAKLAEAERLLPEDGRDSLDSTRFNILIGQKDYSTAYKLAAKMSDAHKDNAMLQNQLAWQMITDSTIEKPDLDLANKIATRANDAAKSKDPAILDTLARVLFMQGKKDKAIELQEKAVNLADDEMKKSLQKTLDSYKKGELTKAD
jgi:thiol-disulfide isomerase/thioredoxin